MVNIIVGDNVIENVKLCVFDKDGTLIDLYNYWSNMIGLRAEELCVVYGLDRDMHKKNLMFCMGVDVSRHRLRPEGPVGLLPRVAVQRAAEVYLENLGLEKVSRSCFDVFKKVDQISLSRLDAFIKPLAGSRELLTIIKDKGCKIAIATTDKTERAELAVNFLKWGHLIDVIIGADKVKKSKPDPEMLELIAKRMNVHPNMSIMIGDTRTDVLTGINARFKASIGLCSGLSSKNELVKLTQYVVKDVLQIRVK